MTDDLKAQIEALQDELKGLRAENEELRAQLRGVDRMVREALTSIDLLVGLMEREFKRRETSEGA